MAIESYKNLQNLRVQWGARMVLYGPNGAGKSNLFEALSLLGGSSSTMWGVAGRAVQPEPGTISVVVRTGPLALPLGPHYSALSDFGGNSAYWEILGIDEGHTFAEAMACLVGTGPLGDLLAAQTARPFIRYRLESLTGLTEASECARAAAMSGEDGRADGVTFERVFSRTRCLPERPDWLIEMAESLPAPFAPLRRWLSEDEASRSPIPDLLELPSATEVPVRVIWLARERSTAEAWFDLWHAHDQGVGPALEVCSALDRLPFVGREARDLEGNAAFWLVIAALHSAEGFLGSMMPALQINYDDETVASLSFRPSALDDGHYLEWRLGNQYSLDRFSSGERAWVDESLLEATVHLEELTIRNSWRAMWMDGLTDDGIVDLVAEIEPRLVDRTAESDSWSPHQINPVLSQVDRLLPTPESAFGDEVGVSGAFLSRRIFLEKMPTLLEPPAVVRLFDEPERHLHPDAQRRVSRALEVASPLAQVAIATHSHLFLGRPGWEHLHVSPTPEGVVSTRFSVAELDLTHALTRQMGLTRGELLSRFGFVLFVEGKVDEAFLTGRYGDVFADGGVLILPISGIDEVKSLGELHLIGKLLDVGAGVLADHVRIGRLTGAPPSDLTKEELALRDLRTMLQRRQLDLQMFGLERVDIIAYLDEDVIRRDAPDFPGWAAIQERSRSDRSIGFKKHAAEAAGVHRVGISMVRRIASVMADENIAPPGDLPSVVAQIIKAATVAVPTVGP